MAPTSSPRLFSRFLNNCDNYDSYGNCYYNSAWDRWGRWVALVVIVFVVLLIAFAFSCTNARRRRRRGMAPRYGTGWLGGKMATGNNGNYYNNQQQPQYGAAAPPYSPPAQQNQQYTGNTFNSNEGYYGQQSGVELQQPQNAYQPQRESEPVYAAPQGPPPSGKGGYGQDGIIR